MQDYKKIQIWQRSLELSIKMYTLTKNFPHEEIYGLTSQIRRASTSVPLNIAEGAGRKSSKDFANFLSIANGSLNELATLIEISRRIDLLKEYDTNYILTEIEDLKKMLYSFINSLKKLTTNN
jgi:four helix bundle protein